MEKLIAGWMEKLKGTKKNQWFILVLIGILIAVIAIPIDSATEEKQQEETASIETEVSSSEDSRQLEQRLEQTLSKVAGIGEVQVMLTRASGSEKIIEKDTSVSDKENEYTKDEETVYTQDTNGNQIPYVAKELEPQVAGVIVVAEGGGNPAVIQNITEAVKALFGVEAHKIKVMKMN